MPSPSKKSPKKQSKKQSMKRQQEVESAMSPKKSITSWKPFYRRTRIRITALLMRRPHRSFKRTRRRDYARSLQLPGYWAFTIQVNNMLWRRKYLFLSVIVLYGLLNSILVGVASQGTYTELSDMLQNSGTDLFDGNWGGLGQAAILLGTGIVGGINQAPTDAQKIFGPLIVLLIWLTTIWLLRAIMSGGRPSLRDGLYNAGTPIVPTFFVSLMFLIQLLPAAIAALGFWAALQTGFAANGVESMLFWVVIALLVMLSLYWATSTFIALVVITLPGMYPVQAISTAGDMVIGRRLRILLRLFWMSFCIAITWILIIVPVILLDTWIKSFIQNSDWVPTVPVLLVVMSALTVVWSTTYIYLLYRKVIDDDANPA